MVTTVIVNSKHKKDVIVDRLKIEHRASFYEVVVDDRHHQYIIFYRRKR